MPSWSGNGGWVARECSDNRYQIIFCHPAVEDVVAQTSVEGVEAPPSDDDIVTRPALRTLAFPSCPRDNRQSNRR